MEIKYIYFCLFSFEQAKKQQMCTECTVWAIKVYSVERARSHELIANFQHRLDNGTIFIRRPIGCVEKQQQQYHWQRARVRESEIDRSEPKTTLYWPNDKDDSFCRHANLWAAIISSLHSNNAEHLMFCTVSTSTTCILSPFIFIFPFAIGLLASIQIGIYGVGIKRPLTLFPSFSFCGLYAENVNKNRIRTWNGSHSGNFPSKTLCCTECEVRCTFPNSQVSAMQYK